MGKDFTMLCPIGGAQGKAMLLLRLPAVSDRRVLTPESQGDGA